MKPNKKFEKKTIVGGIETKTLRYYISCNSKEIQSWNQNDLNAPKVKEFSNLEVIL